MLAPASMSKTEEKLDAQDRGVEAALPNFFSSRHPTQNHVVGT